MKEIEFDEEHYRTLFTSMPKEWRKQLILEELDDVSNAVLVDGNHPIEMESVTFKIKGMEPITLMPEQFTYKFKIKPLIKD